MTAKQIIKLRQSLGLDQGRLAARLGVSRETVNRWENGANQPKGLSIKALQNLAKSRR
jgi:DNA-binding transcriptional regulator YiaG